MLELLLTYGTLELGLHSTLVLDMPLQIPAGGILPAAALTVVLPCRGVDDPRPQHGGQGEAAHQSGHGAGRGRRGSACHQLLVAPLLQKAAEQGLLQEGVCNTTGRHDTTVRRARTANTYNNQIN